MEPIQHPKHFRHTERSRYHSGGFQRPESQQRTSPGARLAGPSNSRRCEVSHSLGSLRSHNHSPPSVRRQHASRLLATASTTLSSRVLSAHQLQTTESSLTPESRDERGASSGALFTRDDFSPETDEYPLFAQASPDLCGLRSQDLVTVSPSTSPLSLPHGSLTSSEETSNSVQAELQADPPFHSPQRGSLQPATTLIGHSPTDPASTAGHSNHEPESDHDLYHKGFDRPPFRSEEHASQMMVQLNELRRCSLLCDVSLEAGDVRIPAHRNVLAANSPYFQAMFTGDMAEARAGVVHIQEVDGWALSRLIDFMYSSEIVITEETVQTLLPAASFLGLSSVREACCVFLQSQLHPSNCIGIQRFADMHDCTELLTYCQRFTEQHFSEVLEQSDEFLNLSTDQLIQIISSDSIRVSEVEVFESVLRWIRHSPEGRQTQAARVCGHVRFALLPRDYLVKLSQSDDFLYENPWCKDYLLEAMGYHLLLWEQKRVITSERSKPRIPTGAQKVLVVLGGQAPKAIRSVECYDFYSDKWSMAPCSSPGQSVCGLPIGDSSIETEASLLSGLASTNRRTVVSSKRPFIIPELPTRRCRCGVAVLGGSIYVIGGFNGALRVRSVDIYDAGRNVWKPGPNMEYRRSTLGVAVLHGHIYAIGGFDGTKGFSSVETFDPWLGAWQMVAPMSQPRSSIGVDILEGRLIVVGGYNGSSRRCLSSVESFEPAINAWRLLPEMHQRRSGPAVVELNDRLYAVGGHDGPLVHTTAEFFNEATATWQTIADTNIPRRNAGLVSNNGLLYVVGGDDGSTNLTSVETYDPRINRWTLLSSHMNTGRSYAGMALVDRSLI